MALINCLLNLGPGSVEGELVKIPREIFDINGAFLAPRATILGPAGQQIAQQARVTPLMPQIFDGLIDQSNVKDQPLPCIRFGFFFTQDVQHRLFNAVYLPAEHPGIVSSFWAKPGSQ